MKYAFVIFFALMSMYGYAQFNQDCGERSYPVSTLTSYTFDSIGGFGDVKENLYSVHFSSRVLEKNSFWMTWEIEKSGYLSFDIRPIDANDDLDFFVFSTSEDCASKEMRRCMLSGEPLSNKHKGLKSNCSGATGLRLASTDVIEKSGCGAGDDNYLKALQSYVGETYYLMINNFDSGAGFSIDFHGDAVLKNKKLGKDISNGIELLSIVPNPAQDEISIEWETADNRDVIVNIYSELGGLTRSRRYTSKVGVNRIIMDISDMQSGVYLVEVQQQGYIKVEKIVKL